jgi:hypothetical protein
MSSVTERVIKQADERKEFAQDVDGFVYWWPSQETTGAFSGYILRAIADELDRRNAEWNKQINNYFENESNR